MERPLLPVKCPTGSRLQCNFTGQWAAKTGSSIRCPGFPSVFGCESQGCGDGWDFTPLDSPDGRFITWLKAVTDVFRMWPPWRRRHAVDPFVNMSVWSGASLYFDDSKDVSWRNGVVSTFLPGVVWISQSVPSRGSNCVRDAGRLGVGRTYVVDTTTAKSPRAGWSVPGSRPS